MKTETLSRCELLINNREALRPVMRMQGDTTQFSCALLYALNDKEANADVLASVRQLLKQQTGVFSSFRGMGEYTIIAMLAMSDDPQVRLEKALRAYEALRKSFHASDYLPLAALTLSTGTDESRYDEVAYRAFSLYQQIRKMHPMISDSADISNCLMMALSDTDDTTLLQNAEFCFGQLKESLGSFSGNARQAIGFALTQSGGDMTLLCDKVAALYKAFMAAGCKWSMERLLPLLGALALRGEDADTLVKEVLEAEAWLKPHKGMSGFFASVDRATRLCFASLIVISGGDATGLAANEAVTHAIQQQMLMTSCMISVSVATAAATSHHS